MIPVSASAVSLHLPTNIELSLRDAVSQYDNYILHGEQAFAYLERIRKTPEWKSENPALKASLLSIAAAWLDEIRNDPQAALACYQEEWEYQQHLENPAKKAICALNLSSCFGHLENNEGGYTWLLTALPLLIETHGHNHGLIAGCYQRIASYHHDLGHLEQALEFYDQAIAIMNAISPNDPHLALCHSNKARSQESLHHFEEALQSYQTALSFHPQHNHPEILDIAELHIDIGRCYQQLQRYGEALVEYLLARPTLQQHFGNNHERVTSCQRDIDFCRNCIISSSRSSGVGLGTRP